MAKKHRGNSNIGSGIMPIKDSKHLWGSPEEIANRTGNTHLNHPQNNPPSFQQIGHSTGNANLDTLTPTVHHGEIKFGTEG